MRLSAAFLLSLLAGSLTALQSAINSNMSRYAGSHGATLINFAVGTAFLALLFFLSGQKFPATLAAAPFYLYLGGLLGAAFVFTMTKVVPVAGVTASMAGVIAGQLLLAAILDHFGVLGLEQIKLNPLRITGILLLIAGTVLIYKGRG